MQPLCFLARRIPDAPVGDDRVSVVAAALCVWALPGPRRAAPRAPQDLRLIMVLS